MDVIDDLTRLDLQQPTILTIGAFDGVHLGHQNLIGAVVDRARETDRLAALITFHPHPAGVLVPERAPRYLTTPGEKVAILERLGLDIVVLWPFDRRLAVTPAREFMQRVCRHLRPAELWVGSDFALGRKREGDTSRLRELGRELGYETHVVAPIVLDGRTVSSTRIRALLRQGHVEAATRLLGRHPQLSGEVVPGAGRGHALGFPTANLEVRAERAVPADGVYATFAVLGNERYPALTNVGFRPSFDNGRHTIESHILDFEQDIYGCDLVVEFVARLRDEQRFEEPDQLMAQIQRDIAAAREILGREQPPRLGQELAARCAYRYREVEHTADRALYVWGARLPDLWVGAARGMYSLMADLDELAPVEWREVRLQAEDRETLLVDWLNELLYLTEIEGLLFVRFDIQMLDERSLLARVGGSRAPIAKASIKAATFHDLTLTEKDGGWSTVITFDV